MGFPAQRPRRLRGSAVLRRLAAETRLHPASLIQPLFVVPGRNVEKEIPALPGQRYLSADRIGTAVARAVEAGIGGVILFGQPERKSADGQSAWDAKGPVQEALRAARREAGGALALISDVCLCAYLSHGHCGVVKGEGVDNDATLPILGRVACSHAEAGTDVVAPSDMMDGRVGAIRGALDGAGFQGAAILSYAAKYASAFYGPFREVADSAPEGFGREGYQMDPPNRAEAMREITLDIEEGADAVMVKPALAYLDVLREAATRFDAPLAAYNVSGEYAMVKATAARGWLDERRAALEILTSIRRAGASMIVTYWAVEAAGWLGGRRA
ncbi:MAG: porphobilinogen synthase [Planctomycetes bacterium]|nr:porphobilinogen synthase [Planctomycetota bacterium]